MNKYAILKYINEKTGKNLVSFLVSYEEKVDIEGMLFQAELTNVYDVFDKIRMEYPVYFDEDCDYLFEAENDEEAKLIFEVMKNE